MMPGLCAGCQSCSRDWGLFHVCKMGAEAAICVLLSLQSSPVRNMELYLGNHNRGRERHTEGERGEEWNKLPLTMTDIYRTTCFWLQSISLFISDLSQMAQHTRAYCKTGAAGPTEVGCDQCWANSHKHTINSSLSEHIRLCTVANDRGEHRRVKNKETKSCLDTNFFLRILIDSLTHSPRHWATVVIAEVMYEGE